MDRYLITGGTGFIGANFARRLVYMNKDVHLLVRKECNMWRIKDIKNDLSIHVANLLEKDKVKKAVQKIKPDIIFHFAVYGAYPFQQDVNQMFQTNIVGTANLINACQKIGFKLFIDAGTSSEYGFKNRATKETDLPEPNSYYAVTKASATLYCSYVGKAYKLPIITFRLYSVYGPYEEPSRFIPTLINYALKGKLPRLVSPKTARDFIYIDDVIDAYLIAVESDKLEPGEIYNIGTGKQTSIKDVVDIVKETLGVTTKPRWDTMPGRIWDTTIWVADITKAKNKLGWQPKYSVIEGLQKTIEWFKEKSDLYEKRTIPNLSRKK